MHSLRLRKEKDKYVLSVVGKDLKFVQLELRSKGVNRRGDDVLEVDSSDLVNYITEASRILEDVYG
jgi:hypothetical protein